MVKQLSNYWSNDGYADTRLMKNQKYSRSNKHKPTNAIDVS